MSTLNWDDYQDFVGLMATPPPGWKEPDLALAGLGMAGEAGEVADLIKKLLYHNRKMSADERNKLLLEAGDVLWYNTLLARLLNSSLKEIAEMNVDKLSARYPERLTNFGPFEVRTQDHHNHYPTEQCRLNCPGHPHF